MQNSETDTFINYLIALEDFGTYQDIDIWIVTNPGAEPALDDAYTNVDIEQIIMPVETQNILNSAYEGIRKNYSDYDKIYQKTMLHLAAPIRNNSGDVIGAVVVSGPMEMQENIIIQYEKYMAVCAAVGH